MSAHGDTENNTIRVKASSFLESIGKGYVFKLLQNQICEGGGLHAVLHMCPTLTNTGPSSTTKGDIVQMSQMSPCKHYTTIISPHIISAQNKQRSAPLHNAYYTGTRDATIGWTSLIVPRQNSHPSLRDDLER